MVSNIRRKGAVETVGESFGWLTRNPVLLVLFLVVGATSALGEVVALFAILAFFLQLFFDGVAHLVARDEITGDRPDIAAASSHVLSKMLSLIGIAIIYFVLVVIGTILFIIPGIYLAVRLSLSFPACVIDDQRAFESLSTSWDVAHGNLLKLLGISLLVAFVSLAVFLVAIPLTLVFAASETAFILSLIVLVSVFTAIIRPISQMAYARVYLENRAAGSGSVETGTGWDDDRNDEWAGGSERDDYGWDN